MTISTIAYVIFSAYHWHWLINSLREDTIFTMFLPPPICMLNDWICDLISNEQDPRWIIRNVNPRVVIRVKVRTVNPKEVFSEEGLSHCYKIVLHTGNTWGASKNLNVQAHPAAIKPEVQGWHSGIRISTLIQEWEPVRWATKNQGATATLRSLEIQLDETQKSVSELIHLH